MVQQHQVDLAIWTVQFDAYEQLAEEDVERFS